MKSEIQSFIQIGFHLSSFQLINRRASLKTGDRWHFERVNWLVMKDMRFCPLNNCTFSASINDIKKIAEHLIVEHEISSKSSSILQSPSSYLKFLGKKNNDGKIYRSMYASSISSRSKIPLSSRSFYKLKKMGQRNISEIQNLIEKMNLWIQNRVRFHLLRQWIILDILSIVDDW